MPGLIRYSPEWAFERAQRFIDRFLDEPLAPTRWLSPFQPLDVFGPWRWGLYGEVFPGDNLPVDLYEEGDRLVLKASLPGVPKEDIDLQVKDGFLTLRARHAEDFERDEFGWRVRRRRAGFWQRSLRLPVQVDVNRAEAVLQNGVLTVTLPKLEPAKKLVHRIKVNLPKFRLPSLNRKKEGKIRVSRR